MLLKDKDNWIRISIFYLQLFLFSLICDLEVKKIETWRSMNKISTNPASNSPSQDLSSRIFSVVININSKKKKRVGAETWQALIGGDGGKPGIAGHSGW